MKLRGWKASAIFKVPEVPKISGEARIRGAGRKACERGGLAPASRPQARVNRAANQKKKQRVEHGNFHASPPQDDSTLYNGSGDQNVNAAMIKNIGNPFRHCDSLNLRLARVLVRRR